MKPLPLLLPRWVSLTALLLLHWFLALEERLTLWWQTGRWAARDWAQAAVEWGAAPAWVPAWCAARRAPRRVGGAIGGAGGAGAAPGRGVRPPPPTCAALVLAEVSPGEMPVDRAAAVVNWCAQAGITRLFAYDPTGFLKQHAAGLRAHLARSALVVRGFDGPVVEVAAVEEEEGEEARGRVPVAGAAAAAASAAAAPLRARDANAAAARVAAAGEAGPAPAPKKATGGGGGPPPPPPSSSTSTPSIHVHLLSASDAEETMAKAIAAVAAARRRRGGGGGEEASATATATATPTPQPPRAAADASVARLDAALSIASGPAALVEPGVALVYGSAFTLAGYPPWALRAAEIYSMGRLVDADGRGVAGALARYGATHQRFGA